MSLESTLNELNEYMGKECFLGEWIEITQERIDNFAKSTDDYQWIHVDPEQAKNGPFGKTIAHGFLTLSLLPYYFYQVPFKYEGATFRMNYGLNKVRFLAPVPVGSKLRDRIILTGAEVQQGNRLLMTTSHTIEIEGNDTPACIAEALGLIVF